MSNSQNYPELAPLKWARAAFTVGNQSSRIRNIAVQLQEVVAARVPSAPVFVDVFFSSTPDGLSVVFPTDVAIGTRGKCLMQFIAGDGDPNVGGAFRFASDSSGRFDINVTFDSAATVYLVLCKPDGSLFVSSAISWT